MIIGGGQMIDNLSHQVVEMLDKAKELAILYHDSEVTTLHLLMAMYLFPDSISYFLLNEEHITYQDLLDTKNKIIFLKTNNDTNIKYSKKLEELVYEASNFASKTNSDKVFDEHIFYVILKDQSNTAKEVLIYLKINIQDFLLGIEDIFAFEVNDDKEYPFLLNLTKNKKIHPFINTKDYIYQIKLILSKKQKNNPLLIGKAGVGKTAIVEGLSEILENETIYRLDLGMIVAGTKYRGELEDKLIQAMNFVKNQKAILFIDEIHNIVGAGSNDGSLDIANILKPYLSRSDIKCIGATTLDEYYKYIDKDKALKRRFQTIFIEEPNKQETKHILMNIKDKYEEYHQVTYSKKLINYIILKSDKYLIDKAFPDKAIDILDELGATINLNNKKINPYQIVDELIFKHSGIKVITIEKLKQVILNYPDIKPIIIRYLFGKNKQNNILVASVNEQFCINELMDDLYVIFNITKENLLEIDLSMYQAKEDLNQIIGSQRGYVGHDEGGILSEHLIKYPFSVVYIKNFHQAHHLIESYINKIVSKPTFIDNKNRIINLQNTIFLIDNNKGHTSEIGIKKPNKKEIEKVNYDIYLTQPYTQTKDKKKQIIENSLLDECFKKGYTIINKNEIRDKIDEEKIACQLLLLPIGKYVIVRENNLTFVKKA